jgi:serine/threonine-protein kinase PknG
VDPVTEAQVTEARPTEAQVTTRLPGPTPTLTRPTVRSPVGGGGRFGAGPLVALPHLADPDPDDLVRLDLVVAERLRFCGAEHCGVPVGRARGGRPGRVDGHCTSCGTPYSFRPPLGPGDRLGGDRYEVRGPIAHGGVGWVFLATDTDLDNRRVVLKGLINTTSAESMRTAEVERKMLVRLDHPNIVRALDFVIQLDQRTGARTGYLVMEFAGGSSLRSISTEAVEHGYPLPIEHVVAYGLEILAAIDYLHSRGLLYCDLKPENVVHGGGRVRLIDLGAVSGEDDPHAARWATKDFSVPEPERSFRGVTRDADLYTVGTTLQDLYKASQDHPLHTVGPQPVAAGLQSFRAVVQRATDPHWHRRYTSAADMAEQLTGVLREILSLRGTQLPPRQSTVFAPSADLFDDGLGTVPPLPVWTSAPADDAALSPEPLATGRPSPATVAVGLPDSRIHRDDPAAAELAVVSATDAHRLIAELAMMPASVEVLLWRCRAHLALGRHQEARQDLVGAAELERQRWADADELAEKARRSRVTVPKPREREAADYLARYGDRAHSWRLTWHRALVALAQAGPRAPITEGPDHAGMDDARGIVAAEQLFRVVRETLPGELGPILALGYCAEYSDRPDLAPPLYEAVWDADRTQVSAAFGLARGCVLRRDRRGAVRVLDQVPRLSRHYDAAQVAAVRVLAGSLGPDARPTPADLVDAATRLERLQLDDGWRSGPARDRLVTALRQGALDVVRHTKGVAWRVSHPLFGDPVTENGLRDLLAQSFRDLRRQATDDNQHGTLVDLANTARRRTLT